MTFDLAALECARTNGIGVCLGDYELFAEFSIFLGKNGIQTGRSVFIPSDADPRLFASDQWGVLYEEEAALH